MWEYRAAAIRAIDADTLVLNIDQGFGSRQEEHIRLLDVSAPELHQPGGVDALWFVNEWLRLLPPAVRWPILLRTQPNTNTEPAERRTLVRYLGHITDLRHPERHLNTDLNAYLSQHPEWGTGR